MDPRSRTRNVQVRRIIRIVEALQRGWWRVPQLAAHIEVSPRTVRRDLAAIRDGRVRLAFSDALGWTLDDCG